MRNVRIYSGNEHSAGSALLAHELHVLRLRHHGSAWHPNAQSHIINWGATELPDFGDANIVNSPENVAIASNKLVFFQTTVGHVIVPPWTDDQATARAWVDQGSTVYARTLLRAHSGAGIVVIKNPVDFVPAPLYTKGMRQDMEFRVHVVNTEVIDVQRKIRDPNRTPATWAVRSHANGFIYVRTGFDTPDAVRTQAVAAIRAVGLDFGAVDVVWHDGKHTATVLEVNTAPGITGQTVTSYANAFRVWLGHD